VARAGKAMRAEALGYMACREGGCLADKFSKWRAPNSSRLAAVTYRVYDTHHEARRPYSGIESRRMGP
jgi:hypothetical protein